MKLNKILAMILALVMVFSFAACGNDEPANEPDAPAVGGEEDAEGRILNVHVTDRKSVV